MSLLNSDYEADKDFWDVKFKDSFFLEDETAIEFAFDIFYIKSKFDYILFSLLSSLPEYDTLYDMFYKLLQLSQNLYSSYDMMTKIPIPTVSSYLHYVTLKNVISSTLNLYSTFERNFVSLYTILTYYYYTYSGIVCLL